MDDLKQEMEYYQDELHSGLTQLQTNILSGESSTESIDMELVNHVTKQCYERLDASPEIQLSSLIGKDQDFGISIFNRSKELRDLHPAYRCISGIGRMWGCVVMTLMADSSKNVPLQDRIDILRSWGRSGIFMRQLDEENDDTSRLKSLSIDCLQRSVSMWRKIGALHLVRIKSGVELEMILQDVWVICIEYLSCVIHDAVSDSNESTASEIMKSLQDLQSLLPHLPQCKMELYNLIMEALVKKSKDRNNYVAAIEYTNVAIAVLDQSSDENDSVNHDGNNHRPSNCSKLHNRAIITLAELHYENSDTDHALKLLSPPHCHENERVLVLKIKILSSPNCSRNTLAELLDTANRLFEYPNFEAAREGAQKVASKLKSCDDIKSLYKNLGSSFPSSATQCSLDLIHELVQSNTEGSNKEAHMEMENLIQRHDTDGISNIQQVLDFGWHIMAEQFNSENFQACVEWGCQVAQLANDKLQLAKLKRILSSSFRHLKDIEKATSLANEALALDPSKTSIFSCFVAVLATPVSEIQVDSISSLLEDLVKCPDFEILDLAAFAAECHEASNDSGTLLALDELIDRMFFSIEQGEEHKLPFGDFIQAAAQIRLNDSSGTTKSNAYSDNNVFLKKYSVMVLQVLKERTTASNVEKVFGSEVVAEWLYGMCYNCAVTSDDPEAFSKASDIATEIINKYPESSSTKAFIERRNTCLVGAISLQCSRIEELSQQDLEELFPRINSCRKFILENQSKGEMQGDTNDEEISVPPQTLAYILETGIIVRIKLLHQTLEEEIELAKTYISDSSTFSFIAQFAMKAVEYHEQKVEYINRLKEVATSCFKYSLQLLLQNHRESGVKPDELATILMHLIKLSKDRTESYQWLLQVQTLGAKLNLSFPRSICRWFVAYAWNTGVNYYRSENPEQAKKFTTMAVNILDQYPTVQSSDFPQISEQYQAFLSRIAAF